MITAKPSKHSGHNRSPIWPKDKSVYNERRSSFAQDTDNVREQPAGM